MDTVVCPKCGTENPTSAMNCVNCRINLQWAAEHAEQAGATEPDLRPAETESRRQPLTRGQKVRDLLIGFAAWLVVSGLLAGAGGYLAGLVLAPLGVIALVSLAFRWRWLALGWLAAYALNLIVALVVSQMVGSAACGVPVFMPSW